MTIDEKLVEYVAGLARLRFGQDELKQFTQDLQNIITYFDKLGELDTDGTGDFGVLAETGKPLREDIIEVSSDRELLLMNAPTHDDEYIILPRVIE